VAEQLLDRPDVVAGHKQVRGEIVSQGVWADRLADPAPARRVVNGALRHQLVQMIALRRAETGSVQILAAGNTHCHPHSRFAFGYFRARGVRQLHATESGLQIALVETTNAVEMFQEGILHAARQHGYSIPFDRLKAGLLPLPSRTRISFRVNSMSFTRSRKHSINGSPDP
jgi:hypothetical protein